MKTSLYTPKTRHNIAPITGDNSRPRTRNDTGYIDQKEMMAEY